MVKKNRYLPEAKPRRQRNRYLPESLNELKNDLEAQLTEFQAVVEGLPPLPKYPIKYEGWFRDVKKRLQISSQTRTTAAHVQALRMFNDLHQEWLKLGQINYELSRIGDRAKVDDLKIQVEVKELKLQMARMDAEMRELRTKKLDVLRPPTSPAPQETFEERCERLAMEEIRKWDTETRVEDKIIQMSKERGKSEEDARAYANEVIRTVRKRLGRA